MPVNGGVLVWNIVEYLDPIMLSSWNVRTAICLYVEYQQRTRQQGGAINIAIELRGVHKVVLLILRV